MVKGIKRRKEDRKKKKMNENKVLQGIEAGRRFKEEAKRKGIAVASMG